MISSYPKIYAIGHAAVSELFLGPVTIEEKIDGSQFSFMRDSQGELHCKSKGAIVYAENPGMFRLGVETAQRLSAKLTPNWTYRGEFLRVPKHNVLAYNRTPVGNFILFDVNTGNEVYLSREAKVMEASLLELEIVPHIFTGVVENHMALLGLLDQESILGGQNIEGIVVKNYSRFGADKHVLMGKYVSEAFKESHAKDWKASNPNVADVVELISQTLRTDRRWQKAVEALRDRNLLDNSPKDIGQLIKLVQQDVETEESGFIAQKLLEWALPKVQRGSTNGLPQWYKERLLQSAFPREEQ